jgi:hypothetical protein
MAENSGIQSQNQQSTGPTYNPNSGPAANRVLSAPLAVLYLENTAIGKLRDVQLNEQYTRANVTELGNIYNVEVPIVGTNFTFTASALVIDLARIGDVNNYLMPPYTTYDAEAIAKSLILGELGCTLELFRIISADGKQWGVNNSLGNDVSPEFSTQSLVKVVNCFIESRTFQISDGQIATQQITGRYLTPWQAPGNAAVSAGGTGA